MEKKSFNSIYKILLISSLIIVFIIGGVVTSLSILKNEAIKTHVKIAELHANTFSEHISQTFNSVELTIDSINTVLKNIEDVNLLENKFKTILSKTPYIRSINLLDENKKVIYSSNNLNLALYLDSNDFYPKPLFNPYILRFGNPWIGRDLIDGIEVTRADKIDNISSNFLPVLKMININKMKFYILITINSDYFINKYIDNLNNEFAIFDLIRIDNTILFSSNISTPIGSKLKVDALVKKALNSSKSSGIDIQNNTQYMSAYHLTNLYPLNVAIRLNFEKSLSNWEEKRTSILFVISTLVLLSIALVLILIYRSYLEKENEIKFHKKEIESNKKFQTLFHQSTFLAAILKDDGSILDMNKLALDFLKKDLKELYNKKFWDISCWNKDDSKWIKKEILNFKSNSKIFKELYPNDIKNNKRTIDFILSSIELDGKIELVAIGIDTTIKKDREEKLKQAYVVFQNTQDGIMITDSHANIINVNNSFIKTSGYKLSDVLMQNPRILSSGIHDKIFYKQLWEELIKTGSWEGELFNRKKDGTIYTEWLSINTVYNDNGDIKNFIGVFSDTTKQKEQEKKLAQQQQVIQEQSKLAAMGEMIENIAHQWRQPLSVISSIATSMQVQKELGIDDRESDMNNLKTINDSSQYLSKTIDDFRDFLRTDKIKSNFELSHTLERSINLISSKFKNRNIKVIKNIEKLTVEGISNELVQVLMNIFSNSKDAFESKVLENRFIFVDIFKEDNNAIILIKDNAGGIKEGIIQRIFEPYFTTKHKSQGTGIGLYMSQEIINNHMNGSITCFNSTYKYNQKEYKGATFKIVLPLT